MSDHTLATNWHRDGKSTWPDWGSNQMPLAYRVSPLQSVIEPNGRSVTFFSLMEPFYAKSGHLPAHWDQEK